MFKSLHPNIRIRIYTSFLGRVIGSMIFPFMAIYFTNKINATVAGILILIHVIVQFVSGLYGGYLADQLGRKRIMITGEWIRIVGVIGMILANSPWFVSPWLTFVMMLLIGVSSGLVNPAAEAMLIDVSTKETRAFMYSINYWAVNMSMMLGIIIGGWLYKDYFFELLLSLLIMSFVVLWMTSALIQETYSVEKHSKEKKEYGFSPILKSYQTVIKDFPFVFFTLGGIMILALEFQRNNFIAVRLEEEISSRIWTFVGGMELTINGVKLLSLLTVENTLIIVLFTALASKWIKGKSEQPVMYLGFILFGSGYGVLAFSNNIPMLFLAVILLSVGELLYVPMRQSILADIIDDSKRGAYMAFNGFVFQIGKILGALGIIVGEVIGGTGMAVSYIGLVILGILFSRIAINKHERNDGTRTSSKVAEA